MNEFIERMIEKLENFFIFDIFDSPIVKTIFGSVNQIITVCALLCNLQDPIIAPEGKKSSLREELFPT